MGSRERQCERAEPSSGHSTTGTKREYCSRPRDSPSPNSTEFHRSSARAHLAGKDDELAAIRTLRDRIGDFAKLLRKEDGEDEFKALRAAETTGRPLGNEAFIADLERRLGRRLAAGQVLLRGRNPPQGSGIFGDRYAVLVFRSRKKEYKYSV